MVRRAIGRRSTSDVTAPAPPRSGVFLLSPDTPPRYHGGARYAAVLGWIPAPSRASMRGMLKPSLAAVFALSLFSAVPLLGCTETVVVHEPGVRHRGGVPFRGVYQKYAESTFKHGRRVRVANSNGAATVRVEHGRVTYDQTYV